MAEEKKKQKDECSIMFMNVMSKEKKDRKNEGPIILEGDGITTKERMNFSDFIMQDLSSVHMLHFTLLT